MQKCGIKTFGNTVKLVAETRNEIIHKHVRLNYEIPFNHNDFVNI